MSAPTGAAAQLRRRLRRGVVGRCARCGIAVLARHLVVDHVQPLVRGGEDIESNVQALCRRCVESKRAEDRDRPPVIG